jgi:hypothetical protein
MLDHHDHSFVEFLKNTYRKSSTNGEFHNIFKWLLTSFYISLLKLLYLSMSKRLRLQSAHSHKNKNIRDVYLLMLLESIVLITTA